MPPPNPQFNTNLSTRQREVLAAIVQRFVIKAEPISSKMIAEQYPLGASSATIRNTMGELERFGLIEHPHTSAGRLPTDLGYRLYIDSLLKIEELSVDEKKIILAHLNQAHEEDEVMHAAAQMLSQVTRLLGMAVATYLDDDVIERLDLIRIAEKKVMIVLRLSGKLIRSLMVELKTDLDDRALELIASVLSQRLQDKTVSMLSSQIFSDFESSAPEEFSGTIRIFTQSILKLLSPEQGSQVNIAGTKNIVQQPEFDKIEDIEGLIEIIDNRSTLVHFLQKRGDVDGVQVTIGRENSMGILQTHSVITSSYNMGGLKRTIGVIGPTRMDYSKLISVVDFTAKALSRLDQQ